MRAERVRSRLAAGLRGRREEIVQATLTRVHAIADPTKSADPAYADGLRVAVGAAIDYGLAVLSRGEERPPPIPAALLVQTRMAARNRVGLDTVLRRYFAGYMMLTDFLVQEVQAAELPGMLFRRMMQDQAGIFEQLLAAVIEEHSREQDRRLESAEQLRGERVRRLLAGELLDTAGLAYDFDCAHLGLIAAGSGAEREIRALASKFDRSLLLVATDESLWAWIGGRGPVDPRKLSSALSASLPSNVVVALGEPARGLDGWRLTHRQAAAALRVAERTSEALVHYVDVALSAAALRDDVLSASLRQIYLEPLSRERDGGDAARATLRAYFAANRHLTSAAASLGVTRNTVASRLRVIDERLGRAVDSAAASIEVALRIDELEH